MIKKILTSILVFSIYTINVYALNNPGDIWLDPVSQQKGEGQSFTVSVQLNNGTTDMDAAKFEINYDNTKVELDTSIGLDGVLRGSDTQNSDLVVNTSPPTGNDLRIVIGNSANLSGDNLNILTINFKTTSAFTSGSTVVELIEEESTVTVETNDGDGDFYNLTLDNVGDATINFLTLTPSTIPDMTSGTDLGISNTDDLTSDTTPDFDLVCEIAGSTLTLYVDGVSTGATVPCVNVGDIVTITAPTSLVDGPHNITYTQTDPLTGVESLESQELNITIDATAPVTTMPDMTPGTDLGISNTDNTTYDLTPTFVGSCITGDIVELYIDGVSSGLTYTCANSSYTFTPTTDLTEGNHNIQVTITDKAGNVSPLSAKLVATIYKIRGDIDDSLAIDTLDIALMQRHISGFDMSSTIWVETLTTSDVNCDGSIDTLDLALEQRYVAGLNMSFTTWCDVKFP